MKSNKRLLIGTAVLLVVVFAASAFLFKKNVRDAEKKKVFANYELLVRSHSPSLGPDDAPVTIVEFLDPECEACGAFHPVVKRVLSDFSGQVKLVVRYMPFHKNSIYAASVLEAVRQKGKYWEALETLFAKQREWARHGDPKPELIMGYIEELGMNPAEVKESLKDFMYADRVKRDEADGRVLGVTGTPTLFINGNRLDQLGYASLKRAVQSALDG